MKDWEYWAEAFGSTINQKGYYRATFEHLWKFGRFYPKDFPEWKKRNKSYWLAKLCDGSKNPQQLGIKFLERKREGWKGSFYYRFHPRLYDRINSLWKIYKKHM